MAMNSVSNIFLLEIAQADTTHENCLMDITCETCLVPDCDAKALDLEENMFEVSDTTTFLRIELGKFR